MKKNLLKKLAKLAKLKLSDKQLEKYSKEISSILDYVGQMNKVNTDKIEPMAHAINIKNIMRQDKIKSQEFKNENLGKYFKTKAIFK